MRLFLNGEANFKTYKNNYLFEISLFIIKGFGSINN